MGRWSKLQKELYRIIDPEINLQVHCVVYPMRSQRGGTDLPRYWITLDKEIIFDYPKDIPIIDNGHGTYPYVTDVSDISDLIREYIDTPVSELMTRLFDND